ncbi:alkaline phosphatase D family protein [Bowmanella dokdonensis]|uniref:Alkaline phosphatase family protein n=1 Tax=Bowmanella dokdonensis TaxID=751969 RepID=A0A939IPS9_9ALTE|nr:alkaline phosphatase D family protein [Bowmanella dokdonensis]MBN7823756.1 alkaline phosphatase family protein [Bowmanella dokdonensis]
MTDMLPLILAGPLLRHTNSEQLTFWLVTSRPCTFRLQVWNSGQQLMDTSLDKNQQQVQVGRHCFVQWLSVRPDQPLPLDNYLEYDLLCGDDQQSVAALIPDLCYEGQDRPGFMLKSQIDNLLHGSCRKPHHPSADGLLQVDRMLEENRRDPEHCPALLLFSGDQVYADDVAGPTLCAIHQVIDRLGLFDEVFDGANIADTRALKQSPHCYYQREQLLPANKANEKLVERFFVGARKPIFTSSGAHNHLISFSEVMAMYLLVWSDTCWQGIDLHKCRSAVPAQNQQQYDCERKQIEAFTQGLSRVRRALAHIPSYMIFDDHDITDDWNLTRGWEESAYGHPFSRRIIGNALIGYWLNQGWGNQPARFTALQEKAAAHFSAEGLQDHDRLIDVLLEWQDWHYHLDTQPKIIVLDTRTHRWRSESSPGKPSGLMDWESLTEMQQELIGQPAVILVSPAPVFGVKLIEAVQKIFTWFGKALVVDAENWMAHPGAANVILNIFRHHRTPPHFVILSGDVHYSFVYDITLRFRRHSPQILQITASGIKNSFPATLLRWFDRLNRLLYGSRSPLNAFTKRRRMLIKRRQPQGEEGVLYNQSGIGQVILSEHFDQIRASVISQDKTVEFK